MHDEDYIVIVLFTFITCYADSDTHSSYEYMKMTDDSANEWLKRRTRNGDC